MLGRIEVSGTGTLPCLAEDLRSLGLGHLKPDVRVLHSLELRTGQPFVIPREDTSIVLSMAPLKAKTISHAESVTQVVVWSSVTSFMTVHETNALNVFL